MRAQWAKFVGETGNKAEVDVVIRLLADPEPRVRFFAAQTLGKLGIKEAVPALIAQRELQQRRRSLCAACGGRGARGAGR